MNMMDRIRKCYIIEAYSTSEGLAYKVRVDGIEDDFICNYSAVRYLISKFYCPNIVAYSSYIRGYDKPILKTKLPECAIVLNTLDTIYKIGGLYVEPKKDEESPVL